MIVEAVLDLLYHAPMSIGLHIQAWRLVRQHSLESLSDKAGISTNLLEAIESEHADPSTATIETLAEALRIPPGWLFEVPQTFTCLFSDSEGKEDLPSAKIDPVTDRILAASRADRSLYVLLTTLVQSGDPKLLRAAEMSLRCLVKQSRQSAVPWEQRPSGHFEPPSD